MQTWLILVLLQRSQTYYSGQPPTLCQTVALPQPTHSLIVQHFPDASVHGQVPATSQSSQTMALCRCLRHYMN